MLEWIMEHSMGKRVSVGRLVITIITHHLLFIPHPSTHFTHSFILSSNTHKCYLGETPITF
jgi:hypothetical protein